MLYDVIIVGGGPAGLSAAMVLGRCRRSVLLLDEGKTRNRWATAMNGFLSRDGMNPNEFRKLGREELEKYGVKLIHCKVRHATCHGNWFSVISDDHSEYKSRKLLLATGLKDRLPHLPGFEEFYGKSTHHCPYCDGWESRDKKLAAYGKNRDGIGLALSLKTWSKDVMLLTDGTSRLSKEDRNVLDRNEIGVCTDAILRLEGTEGQLQRIHFQNGSIRERDVMFFSTGTEQQSQLVRELGCEFTKRGVVKTRNLQQTNVKGLFVAGDAARDVQLVIVAAAEGTKAGVAINMELQAEDRK